MSQATSQQIAIVGVSAQLPSGTYSSKNLDYHSFWDFLLQRGEAYEPIPSERLADISGEVPHGGGSFLKDTTKFDNLEFGVANKDAKSLTASTRRLIELSFLSLLDSGIDSRGKKIGSFMAGTNAEYFERDDVDDRGFGGTPNTLANRVSYTLDLRGPSFYLDTACSSTLTAFHLALRAIRNGDCDAAVVGGCQHNMSLWDWIVYGSGGIMSPDSKCKPFDASANGFAKAEGAVVFVLKPLDAALADNDHIYSVVLGSAVNSNGARAPLHAPSGVAQQECIKAAYKQAGRDPTDVDFVELHATGTAVGDPIECNAAGHIFSRSDDVVVGSLKGNLGHLEVSAFFGSLVKACLILENRIIPPNVNFNTPNPKIHWDQYGLKVPTEPIPLGCRAASGRSLISLASSGIGGSNGHVVIESSPPLPHSTSQFLPDTPVLFVVGGLSPRAAQEISESLLDLLSKDSSTEALSQAVTYARRARQLPWRTTFTFTPGSNQPPKVEAPALISKQCPPLVYVFTGQGPQHINMGRHFFRAYQVFRDTILELDEVYKNVVGVSMIESTGMFAQDPSVSSLAAVWSAEVTIPAITMLQIALYDLLKSVGLTPDVLVGHSAGETALIYASGAGPKAMAMEIAIIRSRAMKLSETLDAGMAALACDADSARTIIERVKPDGAEGVLEIACYNSPNAVVVSGSRHLVEEAVEVAQSERLFARKLSTLNPSHSKLMDVCRDEFFTGIRDIFSRYEGSYTPKLPTYSSVAGQEKIIKEFTPEYLWSNVRSPVHFHQAMSSILEDFTTDAAFVELSPHPALSSYITALDQSLTVVCPMRRPSKNAASSNVELVAFTETLGRLVTLGINSVDLTPLYGRASRDKAYHIPYPFTTRHFPLRVDGPRQVESSSGPCSLRQKMNARIYPDLAQHVINGEPIVPAVAYIDMVLQTGARLLWNLEFKSILSLASDAPVDVRVEQEDARWSVKTSQPGPSSKVSNEFRIHSQGFSSNNFAQAVPNVDLKSIRDRLEPLELQGFYDSLQPLVDFGPMFQRLVYLAGNADEVLAEVTVPSKNPSSKKYVCNPMVMDAAIHFAAFHPDVVQNPNPDSVFLPSKLGAFAFYEAPKPGENIFSHMLLREWTPDTRVFDFTLCDTHGSVICTMHDFELREVSSTTKTGVTTRYDLIYQPISMNLGLSRPNGNAVSHEVNDLHDLLNVLDHFALDFLSNLLRENKRQTNKLHHKRYLEFAEEALARGASYLPSFAEIEGLRSRWPVCFEMTEQLNMKPKVLFNSFNSSDDGATTVFPREMILRFFQSQQIFDSVLDEMKVIFERALSALFAEGKRVIRVLEIGAGKGSSLTSHLCEVLRSREDLMVFYVASDPTLAMAKTVVQENSYEHISAKAYDPSRDPEEQGFMPNTFDIIIGFNSLHSTPDISVMISFLNRLLLPGGSLLVAELDGTSWKEKPGTIWIDTVFGTSPEWLSYTDERECCTLAPDEWQSKLQKTGYDNVQIWGYEHDGLAFVFTCQRSHTWDPISSSSDSQNTVFLQYKYGDEMIIQRKLSEFDINEPLSLWLIADSGISGHAGIGLVQSIIHEFVSWDIRLAIFEATLDESEQIANILRFSQCLGGDTVVRFSKDGNPLVPKAITSPPPPDAVQLDPNGAWVRNGTDIVQVHLGCLEEDQSLVEVSAWSNPFSSFRGFVGSIVDSKDEGLAVGQKVVGIAQSPLANCIICHSGHLAVLPDGGDGDFLAEYALPAIIATMVLGHSRMTNPGHKRSQKRIFIADSDDLSKVLDQFLGTLPLLANVSSGYPTRDARFDTIIASSSTLAIRPEIRSWRGKLFVWDDAIRDLFEEDAWSVGDALQCSFRLSTPVALSKDSHITRPRDIISNSPGLLVFNQQPLFDANKAYILLGGVSDLGIHVALWMYQHGARDIILTSRRGRAFFDTNTYTPTKQKLAYLEKREDVNIRLERCDALSSEATSALIKSVKQPIGGCFLMTLVLQDALFMNQTEESFNKVCATKMKALETFTAVLPIERLDFFVSFSSIVALLGNPGQSNYAMSHNLVDGILEKHPNAFSLITPGISQVGVLARAGSNAIEVKHLGQWSLTPDEICDCLGDGLLKMRRGAFISRYIPNLKWNKVDEDVGLSSLFKHLLVSQSEDTDDVKHDGTEVLAMILGLLDVAPEDFAVDVPFVAYGLDSLGATRIAEALRPYANVSQMQLLGGLTWNKLQDRFNIASADAAAEPEQSLTPMLEMVDKYSTNFGTHVPSIPAPAYTGDVILITGTTGAVGASILADLVERPTVRCIYALNRKGSDGRSLHERQRQALVDKGLDPTISDSVKVVLLEGELTVPGFALDYSVLHYLRSSVTHIMHVAWTVNWNHDLAMMEQNVKATRCMLDFALSSPLPSPPRFLFVSTISVLRQHIGSREYIGENFVEPQLACGSGYSESKWVAERLIELAAAQTSLCPVVVRVGQISGAKNGFWNATEWLPSIVQSIKNVGCLPDSLQTISWIPLAVAARSLVELRNSTSSVLHIVHPRPVSWRTVFTRISEVLKAPLVTYDDWLNRLSERLASLSKEELANTPALKLLDAFRKVRLTLDEDTEAALPKVSVDSAVKESPALADAPEITSEDVDKWLSYWTTIGLI